MGWPSYIFWTSLIVGELGSLTGQPVEDPCKLVQGEELNVDENGDATPRSPAETGE